ncbi:MAG: hypothetical protein WCO90_01445, partial [Planctomycetota bacterium]
MARRAAVFLTWLLITAVGDGFLGMPSQAEAPPVEAGVAEAPESDMEDVAGTATTDGSPEPVPARPTPSDAQVLAVEQQLLCPLCVNERLDVCTLAICNDMK